MERHFIERENLQALLEAEWKNYRQAIKDDKPFEEVKIIFLRIKELQTKITEITEAIHQRLKMGD